MQLVNSKKQLPGKSIARKTMGRGFSRSAYLPIEASGSREILRTRGVQAKTDSPSVGISVIIRMRRPLRLAYKERHYTHRFRLL